MSQCANCGTVILFGGVIQYGSVYCGKACAQRHSTGRVEVPDAVLDQAVREVHQGDCPVCGGPGPVDIHSSHRVMSFLIITQFQTIPRLSCGSCAKKAKLFNSFVTGTIGWLGVPFGLIFTPIYLTKNLVGLCFSRSSEEPSAQLREFTRSLVVQNVLTQAMDRLKPPEESDEEDEDADEEEEEY